MMRDRNRRLFLNKETIRVLKDRQLHFVRGGGPYDYHTLRRGLECSVTCPGPGTTDCDTVTCACGTDSCACGDRPT